MTTAEIIMNVGIKEYRLWLYLQERNFQRPNMNELVAHFEANPRTIRTWIKKLEQHGCI